MIGEFRQLVNKYVILTHSTTPNRLVNVKNKLGRRELILPTLYHRTGFIVECENILSCPTRGVKCYPRAEFSKIEVFSRIIRFRMTSDCFAQHDDF